MGFDTTKSVRPRLSIAQLPASCPESSSTSPALGTSPDIDISRLHLPFLSGPLFDMVYAPKCTQMGTSLLAFGLGFR
jgi:hypothetical protein